MAWANKVGIGVASGFKLQAEAPIDARFLCDTTADLDELVTIHAAYPGLQVFCKANKITYKYDGTKWLKTDEGKDISEVLNRYLPLAGGKMTGDITFNSNDKGVIFSNGKIYGGSNRYLTVESIEGIELSVTSDGDGAPCSLTLVDDGGITAKGTHVDITLGGGGSVNINQDGITTDLAITAKEFKGNSSTTTQLKTARKINGTSFNGTADITTSLWGTSRTITVGKTAKSVNGSANVTWSLEEIGVAPNTGSTDIEQLGPDVSLGDGTSNSSSINGNDNKIVINKNDPAKNGDVIYNFQTSTDGGKTYNSLVQITDEGKVIANTFVGNLNGNADTATKLKTGRKINGTVFDGSADITTASWGTARTISLTGGATASASIDGSKNVAINVTAIDGTKITGVIPLSSIPKSAQERCVTVADKAALFKLTTSDVQLGDTVRVLNVGNGRTEMFYVVDESKLTTDAGYAVFSAGNASLASEAVRLQTARTITIGKASKAFDGTANITFTAAELGIEGEYLSLNGGTMRGAITMADSEAKGIKLGTVGTLFSDTNGINLKGSKLLTFTGATGIKFVTASGKPSVELNTTNMVAKVGTLDVKSADGASVGTVIANLTGNASSATKLQTARTIALSGGATGTATSFNGTANISIPVTKLSTSVLYVPEGDVLILDGNAV